MRRVPLMILLALTACATPPITLTQRHTEGERRIYDLEASASTTVTARDGSARQRTVLRARSQVDVLAVRDEDVIIRLTVAPSSYEQDGERLPPPPEQIAEMRLGFDGEVLEVTSIGGIPAAIIGTDVQDLAPLLGMALPTERVRVGERWSRELSPPDDGGTGESGGTQAGRIAGLRVVRGFDCAIVSLTTRRPLTRERAFGQDAFQLVGTETSAVELAFAFRHGFPVEIRTVADGDFELRTGGQSAGMVAIESVTTLRLIDPSS